MKSVYIIHSNGGADRDEGWEMLKKNVENHRRKKRRRNDTEGRLIKNAACGMGCCSFIWLYVCIYTHREMDEC